MFCSRGAVYPAPFEVPSPEGEGTYPEDSLTRYRVQGGGDLCPLRARAPTSSMAQCHVPNRGTMQEVGDVRSKGSPLPGDNNTQLPQFDTNNTKCGAFIKGKVGHGPLSCGTCTSCCSDKGIALARGVGGGYADSLRHVSCVFTKG